MGTMKVNYILLLYYTRTIETTRHPHECCRFCGSCDRVRHECGFRRGGMVMAVVIVDRSILVESLSRSALTSSNAAFTPTLKEGFKRYGLQLDGGFCTTTVRVASEIHGENRGVVCPRATTVQ